MLKSHKNLACLEVLEYQLWDIKQQVMTTEKKKKQNNNKAKWIYGETYFKYSWILKD